MEAELHARARQLQQLNEELRQAHARERRIAVALQETMLHTPGRFTIAVGEVVGHGLIADTVIDRHRSALSAATRTVQGPAQDLEVPGWAALRTLGRGSPGRHRRPGHGRLPQPSADLQRRPLPATHPHHLYDDLIERRGEDIDTGLTRLPSALATCTGFGAEHLADALLARLDVTSGATDDIVLVAVRLEHWSKCPDDHWSMIGPAPSAPPPAPGHRLRGRLRGEAAHTSPPLRLDGRRCPDGGHRSGASVAR
ncbi:hypothetical protein ACWC2T_42355 [Streptomyces sp. NPDC001393]